MFPARCKVVHVVCVFPVEEIRVRLFMLFKSEALTLEEGKEQERVQLFSKGVAERVLTGVVVFPPPGAEGATTAVTPAKSAPLLMLTGQESPADLGGWEQTVVVTETTKVVWKSLLKSCMLRQDLLPWCALAAVAEEVVGMLVAQGPVFFTNLGLSCPLLFSGEFCSFRHVCKERCWWGHRA